MTRLSALQWIDRLLFIADQSLADGLPIVAACALRRVVRLAREHNIDAVLVVGILSDHETHLTEHQPAVMKGRN